MPEITAEPDDGLDLPDPDDELDPDDDPDEDDGEPVREPPQSRQPTRTYEELVAENDRLQRATRRNNQELAKRRHVQDWMTKHEITDFDVWLAERGIDRETGAPVSPAAAPADSNGQDGESARQAALDLERERAQWEDERTGLRERYDTLADAMKRAAVVAALAKARFSGTDDKALRVVDLTKVAVGEGGEVTGATEAVEALKSEIPEWFRDRGARPPVRTGGEDVDGGRRPAPPPKKMTWEQRALDQMIPGAGRR